MLSPPGDEEAEAHRGAATGPRSLTGHERTECWSSPARLLPLGTVFRSVGRETPSPQRSLPGGRKCGKLDSPVPRRGLRRSMRRTQGSEKARSKDEELPFPTGDTPGKCGT